MSDHSELKKLAEAAPSGPWRYWGETANEIFQCSGKRVLIIAHDQSVPACEFIAAANPAAVLALIAEVEALRKDKERLDALEANFWDVRHVSTQVGMEGDTSESIEIVGSWMGAPRERVIGENYSENLRAAIDQAMTADACPPARPEYEEE